MLIEICNTLFWGTKIIYRVGSSYSYLTINEPEVEYAMKFSNTIIVVFMVSLIAVSPVSSSVVSAQSDQYVNSWFAAGSMERYSISINNSGSNYEGSLSIQIQNTFGNGTYNWTGSSSPGLPDTGNFVEPQFYPDVMMGPFQAVNSSVLMAYNSNELRCQLYGMSIYSLFRGYDYGNVSEIYSGFIYNTTIGSFCTDKVVISAPNVSIQSYIDQKSGILVAFHYYHWYNETQHYINFSAILIGTNVNTTLTTLKESNGSSYTLSEVIIALAVPLLVFLPTVWIMRRKRAKR